MLSRSEGSVTAELAMVLPLIILMVGVVLQVVAAAGIQLGNASMARQAAQHLSQGVTWERVSAQLRRVNSEVHGEYFTEGDLICVQIEQNIPAGPLAVLVPTVSVKECVLDAR